MITTWREGEKLLMCTYRDNQGLYFLSWGTINKLISRELTYRLSSINYPNAVELLREEEIEIGHSGIHQKQHIQG